MIIRWLKKNYLLILILILAFGLRIPHLDGSFWLDEAAQALESSRPFNQQLLIRSDFQPPLIHLITFFALRIHRSEWWLRMIGALIPGLVTIADTYKIGEHVFSRKIGIIASLLLATSSFHIFYSQELRPYSLPAMFALLSWWILLDITVPKSMGKEIKKVLKKPKSFTISVLHLSLDYRLLYLAVCNALGLYSSYLYPFLLISQLVYIIILKRHYFQHILFSVLLTSISFLPWLPSFLGQLEEGGSVRQQLPGWDKVVSMSQVKSIGLTFGKFIYGVLDINLTLLFVSTTVLLLLGILLIYKETDLNEIKAYFHGLFKKIAQKTSKQSDLEKLLILLLAFFVPLITAWLVSFVVPVLQPKRVLYLLPFFYLLFASTLVFAKQKIFAYGVIILLLTINFYSVYNYYTKPYLQRENWQALYNEITRLYPRDNSLVIFSHPEAFSPWRWYDTEGYPTLATGTLHVDQIPNFTEKFKQINNYQYILVFDYLRTLSDPEDKIIKEVESYGYQQIDIINYPLIGFVRVFAKQETILGYQYHLF